jgi:hypothetical protein
MAFEGELIFEGVEDRFDPVGLAKLVRGSPGALGSDALDRVVDGELVALGRSSSRRAEDVHVPLAARATASFEGAGHTRPAPETRDPAPAGAYSHKKAGRPPLEPSLRAMILQDRRENPHSDYRRIAGELRGVGLIHEYEAA